MRIVIAGGTGFLGGPLAEAYAEEGHDVRVLTRSLPSGEARHDSGTGVPGITRVGWKPDGQSGPWADAARRRRRGHQPRRRVASATAAGRRSARRSCATAASCRPAAWWRRSATAATPAACFISGSGVGYYGASGDEAEDRSVAAGEDFLAHLCEDWEAEAPRARATATRVVPLRTGVVLERSGGALPKMMHAVPVLRRRAGSDRAVSTCPGSIAIDWVEMVRWIVETPAVTGPVNATAPAPVDQPRVRARARPGDAPTRASCRRPASRCKLRARRDGRPLALTGQRVLPARALALGYHFRYPEIDQAFRGIFGE